MFMMELMGVMRQFKKLLLANKSTYRRFQLPRDMLLQLPSQYLEALHTCTVSCTDSVNSYHVRCANIQDTNPLQWFTTVGLDKLASPGQRLFRAW